MNFSKILFVVALFLFASSCEKSNPISDSLQVDENILPYQNQENSTVASSAQLSINYSQDPALESLRQMFLNHREFHGSIEPWEYLPIEIRESYKQIFEAEKALSESLGHDNYLDQKSRSRCYFN